MIFFTKEHKPTKEQFLAHCNANQKLEILIGVSLGDLLDCHDSDDLDHLASIILCPWQELKYVQFTPTGALNGVRLTLLEIGNAFTDKNEGNLILLTVRADVSDILESWEERPVCKKPIKLSVFCPE